MKYILSLVFMLIFSGCEKIPECADQQVKENLNYIYQDSVKQLYTNSMTALLFKSYTLPKEITSLKMVRPVSYNNDIQLRTCKAIGVFDRNLEFEINYSIQFSESENDVIVELDRKFLDVLLQQSIINTLLDKKSNDESSYNKMLGKEIPSLKNGATLDEKINEIQRELRNK